jgi:hypothetical protein
MRVYEIAKKIGIASKPVVESLREDFGMSVRSVSTDVPPIFAQTYIDLMGEKIGPSVQRELRMDRLEQSMRELRIDRRLEKSWNSWVLLFDDDEYPEYEPFDGEDIAEYRARTFTPAQQLRAAALAATPSLNYDGPLPF